MKKLIVPLTLVIVVLAAGGFYMLNSRTKTGPAGTPPATGAVEETAATTLKQLMSSGKSVTCTYEYKDEDGGKTGGTMFVAGGKVRGEFTVTDKDGKLMEGSLINDGNTVYTWNSSMEEGMKMTMTEELKKSAEAGANDNPALKEMERKTDYRCRPWTADNSKFTPPANITFRDFSNFLNDIKSSQPETKEQGEAQKMEDATNPCSACAKLPEEAQAACRSTLKCN